MRRSALFVAAGAWALLPAAAFADPINDAVYATAKASGDAAGLDVSGCIAASGAVGCALTTGISNAIKALNVCGGGSSTTGTWATVLRCVLPSGSSVGSGECTGLFCGGDFGGGGASGTWTTECAFKWNIASNGDLLIPSVKLKPGGPIPRVSGSDVVVMRNESASKYVSDTSLGSSVRVVTDSKPAAILRKLHNYNLGLGTEQIYWAGVYKIVGDLYSYSRAQSFYGSTQISRITGTINFSGGAYGEQYVGNPGTVDCPAGQAGGSSHYYIQSPSSPISQTCITYEPDQTLSSSGYAYADTVAWPASDLPNFPNGRNDLKDCGIDPNVIKRIVERAWKDSGQTVPVNQVVYGPESPTVDDVKGSPNQGPTNPTNTTAPNPAPSPTPTSTPSGGSTTNVSLDLGPAGPDTLKSDSNFTPPDWSWWPSMPSISIGTSAQCPTYQFTAFDMQFTLDAHCTFIEQYRALIAALMVIVFTIAAARVVLEA